jgi:hypothetical protein
VARQIRNAQNSLAFHRHYLRRKGRAIEGDPLAEHWRGEVARLRSGYPTDAARTAAPATPSGS